MKHGIEKGLEKLRKWYMATDQSNMYFICLGKPHLLPSFILGSNVVCQALEPSIKLEYAKQKWEKDAYDGGVAAFEKVVCPFFKFVTIHTNGIISLTNTMYLLHSPRSLPPLQALLQSPRALLCLSFRQLSEVVSSWSELAVIRDKSYLILSIALWKLELRIRSHGGG